MSKTKKVILLIVEGITDQISLETVLPKLAVNRNVKFVITEGDITTDRSVTTQNIKTKLQDIVKSFLNSSRLKPSDILQVIHIVDTDGAFISNDRVVENPNEKLLYLSDRIETQHTQGIIDRNDQKVRIVNMLVGTTKIYGRQYAVYFFSRNIEHVLHNNDKELSREEKMALAYEFADRYNDTPDKFLSFISNPDIAVQGTRSETWDFIRQRTNSLKRYSNIHLFLQELTKETNNLI